MIYSDFLLFDNKYILCGKTRYLAFWNYFQEEFTLTAEEVVRECSAKKNIWGNVFWYVKVCIFWKCIQYNIYWDKTQILKKFSSDKINGTKNVPIFLVWWVPTHHSFTFNLRFLYELKHKVRLSKTVCGIFYFWFHFAFIKVYISVQQNAWTLWH